ncbi:AAA family ATPase [Clostridium perfringens]|uniref:Nuclease SbcCD subunit C n=1 Tax=Clostridium perfringens TaxID=1502 RepID=A0AAP4EG90_CLOPF|nr:AAA family ATPase [Clostridium perfringens]MDH2337338.1 AAA family ATPase [Clostridium perfringens]
MKSIILKTLILRNFKGIKDLRVDFNRVTDISGNNAVGKTTIFDAFTWLLFDKNSLDAKDFEIKTLDKNNNVIHGLEHEVSALLNINGVEKKLSKIYKEKWTKKRGEAEKQLTGHTTDYYIDDVPVKKVEFQEAIGNIIDEKLFKLITNPLYFSTILNWKDRRNVLLSIIGDVDVMDVIKLNNTLKGFDALLGEKTVDDLKKTLAARKRKINQDIDSIPFRIDELDKSIINLDFEALEDELKIKNEELKQVEDKLYDSTKLGDVVLEKQQKLFNLKNMLQSIEYKAESQANRPKKELEALLDEKAYELKDTLRKVSTLEERLVSIKFKKDLVKDQMDSLRNTWHEEKLKVLEFNENEFVCPTCKREFEAEDIEAKKESLIEQFNISKSKKLADINNKGVAKKTEFEEIEKQISNLEMEIEETKVKASGLEEEVKGIKVKLDNFKPSIILGEEYKKVSCEISDLEVEINDNTSTKELISSLRREKSDLVDAIDTIKAKLTYREKNKATLERIEELKDEERKLAETLAKVEKEEFQCETFIKAKVKLMEDSINEKFKYVSFKLFNTLVNGAVEECCVATVNGVPFDSVNNAGKINAGIDIINTLCNHYGVNATVFIDNAESVNELLECESQVVRLIVSKDKTLVIS